MVLTTVSDRTRSIWRSRLGSAFRTGLACSIVGCITLFGPLTLQKMVAFPALSYVTVILIVSEATLGDALRGCWNAIYGTLQGVLPAIFIFWMLGHARFSISTTLFVVIFSTFVVVLPASTHAVAKRIALAQIVILYSVTSVDGVHTGALLHPAHVAVSTAVGAFASVLALLLPFPRLAHYEVRKKCKLFNKNASERLALYVKALCAENNKEGLAHLSQAKILAKTGSSLLQIITLKQESMQWERPQCISPQLYYMKPVDKVQALELPLRGMELALTSSPSFPFRVADQELSNLLLSLKENTSVRSDSSTISETKSQILDKSLQTIFPDKNDLPSLFVLYCITLVQTDVKTDQPVKIDATNNPAPILEESMKVHKQESYPIGISWSDWNDRISCERIMLALKCSLSLGFAVFFGMIFSKENGFWSGLTVAVGMAFEREATFKVANLKAQGTVLGSIYGVLSCFIFQRFLFIRFLSLLPWIVFTSFLRQSRMYAPAGAASAVIGALLILGRKNYGPPSEFAIVRIAEAFIGLACSIIVELLLQPTRASTLSKIRLSECLGKLHECAQSTCLHFSSVSKQILNITELKEKEKKLKNHLSVLLKVMGEAEVEPNFWFRPFSNECYDKLHRSLSKMLEIFTFATHAIEFLVRDSHIPIAVWKEHQERVDRDLDLMRRMVCSSIKCLNELTSIKSLAALDKKIKRRDITLDLELGKLANANGYRGWNVHEDEMEKITGSFLQHSRELIDKIHAFKLEKHLECQIILSLSALGFCMNALMKETREMEKHVKDLIQSENPSTDINLHEIYCKINALRT
ncbi:P-hydroxybenzoic acid efflux pump subunit [Thalictrum thalictroides]|uniref:p-hydroxybenzoic acid efflux pump subunit n=1 Tax=Thalictrum thalictroides TaxID=46969 RepID=A0A7J6W7P3_THATH|nr:P-hydroxybenzoic acid efflux pump subunit [Thalictrum thalictroides]